MKKNNVILLSIIGVLVVALAVVLVIFANRPKSDNSSTTQTEQTASQTTGSSSQKSQAELDKLDLPQLSSKVAEDEAEVKIQTSEGDIAIKLFPKIAPMAVENFLNLAKDGYYNNNKFFRVIKNFMIQSGDPTGQGTSSKSTVNNNQPFAVEASDKLYNIRGALSLANTGQPNSSSSQFFIVQNAQDATAQIQDPGKYPTKILDAYKQGGTPQLDGSYTVFGQVISGLEVVDKIASGEVKANPSSGEQSSPVNPVTITGVSVVKGWDFK
ncbi:peptidyl-prolyl cis-trans isomerase [Lactococcus termiticola]|uniref:Peptidyl-prolyl cis-trans isomerase n=1 Tax=Lactococcus termiticola TaxID=2169526 RepID=A0A2R5HDG6_9LACT|nr:peptidylprolyl isomerase [Lactococcus termiticola]GBG96124.1 peptidyl-prolyl cis-trans isomerase [Lactococcus termiticola]